MSKVHYAAPIANMTGKWAPHCVCRQKKHIVGNHVLFGPQELYFKRPRDYSAHPRSAAEQRSCDRFRRAETLRQQEMADPQRRAYWEARFAAQTLRPEPGATKVYHSFPAFVRAALMRGLT